MKKGLTMLATVVIVTSVFAAMTLLTVANENENVVSYWGIDYEKGQFDIGLRNQLNTTQEYGVTVYKQGEVVSNFTAHLPANSIVTYPVKVEIGLGRYAVGLDSEKYDAICFRDCAHNITEPVDITYLGVNYDENLFDIRIRNELSVPATGTVTIYRRKVVVRDFTAIIPANSNATYSIPVETSQGGAYVGLHSSDVSTGKFVKLHCPKN